MESHAPTAQTDVAGFVVLSYGRSLPRLEILIFEVIFQKPIAVSLTVLRILSAKLKQIDRVLLLVDYVEARSFRNP